jgi:AraC-like DNA-binding protein
MAPDANLFAQDARMSHTATTLSSWIRVLKRVLDQRGLDSAALFAAAGLDPAALDDPHARYPVERTTRLWRLAVEASGDEALGLAVASQVTHTTFHALGFSLIASRTLTEAFERTVRYFRIVTDVSEIEFRPADDRYVFSIRPAGAGDRLPAPEAIDAFISLFVRFCRSLAGRDFTPLEVRLVRAQPEKPDAFAAVLRCPLRFAAPANEIHLPRAAMDMPLETADADLARHNEAILERQLADQDSSVKNKVRALMTEQLPQGEPSAELLARRLNLSLRSLQRKLAAEGTSYEELLSDTRCALALGYIRDPHYSISEVAYLLGFSDTGSFTRAFRRWTGQTPSAWRAQR